MCIKCFESSNIFYFIFSIFGRWCRTHREKIHRIIYRSIFRSNNDHQHHDATGNTCVSSMQGNIFVLKILFFLRCVSIAIHLIGETTGQQIRILDKKKRRSHFDSRQIHVHSGRSFPSIFGGSHRHMDSTGKVRPSKGCWAVRMSSQHRAENESLHNPKCSR